MLPLYLSPHTRRMPHLTRDDIYAARIISAAALPSKLSCPGDHGGVVGGQTEGRQQYFNAKRGPCSLKFPSQPRIGRDPTGGSDHGRSMFSDKIGQRRQQLPHDRGLKTRHQVTTSLADPPFSKTLESSRANFTNCSRFEARERKITGLILESGLAESRAGTQPQSGQTVDTRPPGVWQAQDLGDLVEGLAGCIIPCSAQPSGLFCPGEVPRRVSPGRHKPEYGGRSNPGRPPTEIEKGRNLVPVEVIDRYQVYGTTPGERSGEPDSDQQRPDQTRSGRDRHQFGRSTCTLQCLVHQYGQCLEVLARGHFRDDTAEWRVRCDLRRQQGNLNSAVAVQHGNSRLVT